MLGDEHQPQRVVAAAAGVLVQPRAGALVSPSKDQPSFDDQNSSARPTAPDHSPVPAHVPRARTRCTSPSMCCTIVKISAADQPRGRAGDIEQRQRRISR